MGLQFAALAPLAYERARHSGIGTALPAAAVLAVAVALNRLYKRWRLCVSCVAGAAISAESPCTLEKAVNRR